MEPRSIIKFRIVFFNKKIHRPQPISDFLRAESLIARNGISHVRMISFYFNDGYHYPYGIHPITLKQYDNKLYIIFYHYYDVRNQAVVMSMEQKLQDYRNLVSFLDHPSGVLLPLLQSPFIVV